MNYTDIISTAPIVRLETQNETVRLTERDGVYAHNDVTVSLLPGKGETEIRLSAAQTPVKRIHLDWPLRLSGDVRILGDAWERGYGDLEWRGIVPERVMPWYVLLSDAEGTSAYGVKTNPAAMCFWRADGSMLSLTLDVRNGSDGVQLSGRRLSAAKLVSLRGESGATPYETAKALCRLLCSKPCLPRTFVYGSNNWYYAYGNSSHEQVLRDAALLSELSQGNAVRPYLVIDDGWQASHAPGYNGGPWHKGNERFPDMEKLAREIRQYGLRPGLWYRPLVTDEKVAPECRLMREKNESFCTLDPSHPLVLEKVRQMTQKLVSWGYELLKHDFTTVDVFGRWGPAMGSSLTDEGWHFYDRSRTTAEIIGGLYRAIREGAGEDETIIGCNTLSHIAAGFFELQRTGDDTSGREWERTRKMGVNTLAFRMPQHGAFYACDADCAGVTQHIDWKLNGEWLRLLSVSGTPLFVSADPDTVTQAQKEAIKAAFKTALGVETPAEPLNWLQTTCPDTWCTRDGVTRFHLPALGV